MGKGIFSVFITIKNTLIIFLYMIDFTNDKREGMRKSYIKQGLLQQIGTICLITTLSFLITPSFANITTSPVDCDANTLANATDGTVNLTAQYTANNITFTYDANGGTTSNGGTWSNNADTQCEYDDTFNLPTAPSKEGYVFGGWKVRRSFVTIIGNTTGVNCAYMTNSGSFVEYAGNEGQSYYGMTENNSWVAGYGVKGMLYGTSRCSTALGTGAWNTANSASDITTHTAAELGTEGGQYCYCNVTGYKPNGDALQSVSSAWVFNTSFYDASRCASHCIENCASGMYLTGDANFMFRTAVLSSIRD